MPYYCFSVIVVLFYSFTARAQMTITPDEYVTIWKSDNAGSAATTLVIPSTNTGSSYSIR